VGEDLGVEKSKKKIFQVVEWIDRMKMSKRFNASGVTFVVLGLSWLSVRIE